MSVRAYRIITKRTAVNSSFNLWHDDALMNFLKDHCDNYNEQFNEGGGGQVEVSVDGLRAAVKAAKRLKIEEYQLRALKADIKAGAKDGYVIYECY